MKLFVDDRRATPIGWARVNNYLGAVKALLENHVTDLALDHDLGGKKTGYDICLFMVEHGIWPKRIILHTDNVVGYQNMNQLLNRYAPAGTSIRKGRVR